jgi:hypothetical protein
MLILMFALAPLDCIHLHVCPITLKAVPCVFFSATIGAPPCWHKFFVRKFKMRWHRFAKLEQ